MAFHSQGLRETCVFVGPHKDVYLMFTEDDLVLLIQQFVDFAKKMGYTELALDQLQGQIARFMTTKSQWSLADKDVFYKMPPLE